MSLWGHFWVPNMVLWYICLWWIIQFLKFRFLKFKFFHNKFFFWTGSCRMEPAVSILRELVKGVSETCEFSPIGDAHLVPLLHCLIGQVNNWLSVTKLSSAVAGLCLSQQVSWYMSPKWFSEIMAFSWLSPDLYSWKNRILWWRQTCRAEEDWARGGTPARWRKTDVYKFYNFTGIAPMEVSWSIHRKHRKCRLTCYFPWKTCKMRHLVFVSDRNWRRSSTGNHQHLLSQTCVECGACMATLL